MLTPSSPGGRKQVETPFCRGGYGGGLVLRPHGPPMGDDRGQID